MSMPEPIPARSPSVTRSKSAARLLLFGAAEREMAEFPPLDDIVRMAGAAPDEEFLRAEFAPGLAYYVARIDQLMFTGGRALDAGCGAGQWSIALAQRFRQVDAVDLKPNRLSVLESVAARMGVDNMTAREGSIEQLPYYDTQFDAVFCYGVAMFTRLDRTLAEFHRVLRPGGRAYLCLNADGWSRYLIRERGRDSQAVRLIGQTTLYKTYWRRAAEQGFLRYLRSARKKAERVYRVPVARLLWFRRARRLAAEMLLNGVEIGRWLRRSVQNACGGEFRLRLADDVLRAFNGEDLLHTFDAERSYQPDEFAQLAAATGFVDFQWAHEGGLQCDWLRPQPAPKYAGQFQGETSVWECLLTKPGVLPVRVSVDRHLAAAEQAQDAPLYVEPCVSPVISSGTRWTYPRPLLEFARSQAEAHGGPLYLQRLADLLVEGAASEADALERLTRFVQLALFRDPVAQPLLDDGQLPDAATILFAARGRCGHVALLVSELARCAGLESRVSPLPRHMFAEVKVDGRWVIIDADAFKHVMPRNRNSQLISIDDLRDDPLQIDRFPATGWFIRPKSRRAAGLHGHAVRGYVDALEPDDRGYVSGYYVAAAAGCPPSLPSITELSMRGREFRLSWTPSHVRGDRLLGYRVRVGTRSRGWTYDNLGRDDRVLGDTSCDVLRLETLETTVAGDVPPGVDTLFASITPYSSRIDFEPETYFRPSEEVRCER